MSLDFSDYVHFHHPVFGSCYTFNSKGTDSFWTATKPGIPYGMLFGKGWEEELKLIYFGYGLNMSSIHVLLTYSPLF